MLLPSRVAAFLLLAACISTRASDVPRPKLRVPPALVINLPRDAERFAGVKKQMDDQGVYFERIDAVNGRALSESERRANATAAARALLTPGMIGCYLSHRKCWQLCVEGGHDAVLVFEDDAVLMPEFKSKLLGAMEDVPDDWDVLLLGGLAAVHPKLKFGVAGWGALSMYGISMPETLRWPKRISERVHVPVRPAGTHAYAVSARGAAKLLALCPRANFHVDLAAWGQRGLNLYCVNPLLAKQTHEDTTIGGMADRSWIPHFVDEYTGVDFQWAWNTPICLLFGFLLTCGRSTAVLANLFAVALWWKWKTGSSTLLLLGPGIWIALNTLVVRILLRNSPAPPAPPAVDATAAPPAVLVPPPLPAPVAAPPAAPPAVPVVGVATTPGMTATPPSAAGAAAEPEPAPES